MPPEDNPADEIQPTKEEWEAYERKRDRTVRHLRAVEIAQAVHGDQTFYVEARVGSNNYRGECCRALWDGARNNQRADEVIKLLAEALCLHEQPFGCPAPE